METTLVYSLLACSRFSSLLNALLFIAASQLFYFQIDSNLTVDPSSSDPISDIGHLYTSHWKPAAGTAHKTNSFANSCVAEPNPAMPSDIPIVQARLYCIVYPQHWKQTSVLLDGYPSHWELKTSVP
jgi:hypothetical protein